jgi:hypothetical protein
MPRAVSWLLCAAIELGSVPVAIGIASLSSACHPPESPPVAPVPPKPTDPSTSRATLVRAQDYCAVETPGGPASPPPWK